MTIAHEAQREKWNKEHQAPFALKQMDSGKLSRGVALFLRFLEQHGKCDLIGIEMGCGKGRNVIGLACQAIVAKMYGFDFSDVAIAEARRRAEANGVAKTVQFDLMDATKTWKYEAQLFDFGIDCFATTDIESPSGRQFAVQEMRRVLKPGGYLLVYVMSTDDEFHKTMIRQFPAEEANAFYNAGNGKFEKVFAEDELDRLYRDFSLIEARRIEKPAEFFGKSYVCRHHWRIYRR